MEERFFLLSNQVIVFPNRAAPEYETPLCSVIISVIGGSSGFEAKPALQEQIRKSLAETCQSSDAWVITGTLLVLLSPLSLTLVSMKMDSALAPPSLLANHSNHGKKRVKFLSLAWVR
jgi:hypothetical protein